MFTKEDFARYFEGLEGMFKETLVIYTDLLNEVGDQAIRNKLYTLAAEEMEAFKFVKEHKERFA